ncbi:hypothetical protein BURKHO8Y_180097 [Burkholderia sp. 8Y]|nr:hypothetical protein BURKHO8Y_180097 [Burkholderia sp. 8Y]
MRAGCCTAPGVCGAAFCSPLCSMPGPSAASIARSTALRDTDGSPGDAAAFPVPPVPLGFEFAFAFSMALSFASLMFTTRAFRRSTSKSRTDERDPQLDRTA